MTRRIFSTIAIVLLATGLAGAAAWLVPAAHATALSAENAASGLPDSADKVHIKAWFPAPVARAGTRALAVRLRLAKGWHVNANPASMKSLIPTTLRASAGGDAVKLNTQYPPGVDSGIKLGNTDIKVYSNNTTLNATLPKSAVVAAKAAGTLNVTVQVQSCSNRGICLPPAHVSTKVPWH